MSDVLKIAYSAPEFSKTGSLMVFIGDDCQVPEAVRKLIGATGTQSLKRAIEAEGFKGKPKATLTLTAPSCASAGAMPKTPKAASVRGIRFLITQISSFFTKAFSLQGAEPSPSCWSPRFSAGDAVAVAARSP